MVYLNKKGRKYWSVKLLTQVAQPFLTPQNYERCPSSNAKKLGTKRFSILKISIIKSFRSIIEQKKRTNQDSDCQKTGFVRFLYMKSDYCPDLFAIIHDTRSDSTSPYAETLFFVSSADMAHAKKS